MHHSAEWVNTVKRAITLFINIKQVEITQDTIATIVRNSDMTSLMQSEAQEIGKKAIQRYPSSETDIADYIKVEFDKKYGPDWHCIVGQKYGSSIAPQDGSFIYFSHGKFSVLLFK